MPQTDTQGHTSTGAAQPPSPQDSRRGTTLPAKRLSPAHNRRHSHKDYHGTVIRTARRPPPHDTHRCTTSAARKPPPPHDAETRTTPTAARFPSPLPLLRHTTSRASMQPTRHRLHCSTTLAPTESVPASDTHWCSGTARKQERGSGGSGGLHAVKMKWGPTDSGMGHAGQATPFPRMSTQNKDDRVKWQASSGQPSSRPVPLPPPNSPVLMPHTTICPKTFLPRSLGPETCGGASKTGRRRHVPRNLGRIPS